MEDTIKQLKRTLINDIPILFTGAGFNYGAKTKSDLPIPNGTELRRIIIEDYLKYTTDSEEHKQLINSPLQHVSQYAQNETSKNRLTDFLTDYFVDSQPADYHSKLTCYPWRKIYTTNIDDLVESVFKTNRKEYIRQNMKRPSTIRSNSAMHYFKLHGCVNNPSEGYVFSADEYIDSIIQTEDFRFSNFKIDMNNESIIFIGTDFSDFNIDFYLKIYQNSGYESSRGKLFFINPSPSVIFISKVKQYNGLLIQWTTEQFLNFLETEYTPKQNKTKSQFIHAAKAGFLQLSWLKEKIKGQLNGYYSKLYEGNHPKWDDIFSDWDIPLSSVIRAFETFLEKTEGEKYGVFSLYGKAFSGKSTLLKRISNNLLHKGYEVIYFQGRELNIGIYKRLIDKITKTEKGVAKIALVLDNASYSYYAIREILRKMPYDTNTIVLTASRTIQHNRYRYILIDYNLHEFEIPSTINSNYANNIVEKLQEKGFLGVLQKFKSKEEKIAYVKRQNDILAILFQITHGKGFIKRFQHELDGFLRRKTIEQDLLVNLVIFEELGLPFFPKELVNDFCKEKNIETIENVQNFIKHNSQEDFALRTNFFNRQILKGTSEKQLLKQIKEILMLISPLVNTDTHNYWNEIHASLSRPKSLRALRIKPENALKMLYSIRNYYYDNFHYWVQLGIAESNSGEFDKATNHFKQAESLFADSFLVKSAMGTNYMKKAIHSRSSMEGELFLKEGENILTKLIDQTMEFEITSYTTHSYVCQKLNYLKKFQEEISNSEIRKLVNYSELLLDKAPEDFFTKDTRKRLYEYLKSINKTNLMKVELHEINELIHQEKFRSKNKENEDLDLI